MEQIVTREKQLGIHTNEAFEKAEAIQELLADATQERSIPKEGGEDTILHDIMIIRIRDELDAVLKKIREQTDL